MRTISSLSEIKKFRHNLSGTIGLVPTMGALHDGHLSLIKQSNQTCDHTIVSIFINPAQFSEHEDLCSYPKSLDADLELLKCLHVDAVFLPTNNSMYPRGYSTFVNESMLSKVLEGASRPKFFKGVITIVVKLFNIINPSHSFFGEKDAQQLQIIKKIVNDLNYSIDIVSCPIIREKTGLAMSSRNTYLSAESRKSAKIIYNALKHGISILNGGDRNVKVIQQAITKKIQSEPSAIIDYVTISNKVSLEEITGDINCSVLISAAVYFDGVRLIDNISTA